MTRAILSVALTLALAPWAHAQPAMRAATSPAGPGLEVVLTWPTDTSVQRFNLYRRVQGQPAYPPTPLNAAPIARMTDCAALQAVIPIGSADWEHLKQGLADGPATPFDPCAIAAIPPGSVKEDKLQFLARSRWPIAVVAGQGHRDVTVVSGTTYQYQLRGVTAAGAETGALVPDVTLTAGAPAPVPAPGSVTATAGDSRVLVLWGPQADVAGFAVFRATAAAGPYQRVNEAGLLVQVTQDLDGTAIPASNGFLDIRRWDASGNPATHLVQGVTIDGPANGVQYFYRVASLDLLGQAGPLSAAPASATPADKTAPAAPAGVSVTAVDSESRLEVRWSLVEHDVEGHVEDAPMAGYRLFRYESQNAPLVTGVQIGGLVASPPLGQPFVVASDSAPLLRPAFGEQTFWYRMEALDAAGNVSARSVAVGGHLADITPPAPPKGVTAEGFDDFIRVRWNPNTEPDLDGYQIYRSLCHYGVCNPCEPDRRHATQPAGHDVPPDAGKPGKQEVCGGPYALVGTVSRADAEAMGSPVTFADHTIPAKSPLCYSYWVKALDRTQNRSGAWPVPDPAIETTVCQRLRDKEPPDPAIISGLFARDDAIRVEWVGPPVQDIRAYHVHVGRGHDRRAGPAHAEDADEPVCAAASGQLRHDPSRHDRVDEHRVLHRHEGQGEGDLLVQGRGHRPERQRGPPRQGRADQHVQLHDEDAAGPGRHLDHRIHGGAVRARRAVDAGLRRRPAARLRGVPERSAGRSVPAGRHAIGQGRVPGHPRRAGGDLLVPRAADGRERTGVAAVATGERHPSAGALGARDEADTRRPRHSARDPRAMADRRPRSALRREERVAVRQLQGRPVPVGDLP
jgi:hypothetical protein